MTGAADAAAILAGSLGISCAILLAGLPTFDLLAGFDLLDGFAFFSCAAEVLPRAVALPPLAAATGTLAADGFGTVFPAALRTALTTALGLAGTLPRCFVAEACLPAATLPGAALAAALPVPCVRGVDFTVADFLAAGLLRVGALSTPLPAAAALPAARVGAAVRCTGLLTPRLGAVAGLEAAVFLLAATFFAAGLATGFFTAGPVTRPTADFAGALAALRAGLAAAFALLAGRFTGDACFAFACAAPCVPAAPLP